MTSLPRPESVPDPAAAASDRAPRVVTVQARAGDLVPRIAGAMVPLAPALVLIFGMPACGLAALGAGLRDRLGAGCHVVGCASAGEIGPQGYAQDSVVALGFPGASFRAGLCVLRDQAQVPVSAWMASLRRLHAEFRPDLRSCIITLTHDPKLDDLALLEALETPAFYVGAIGSRLNNTLRRERMSEYFDISQEALARLRAPVGIYIGSKTPAEIAVSIMAEVLAVKNGVPLPADLSVAVAKDIHGVPLDGGSLNCAI